MINDILYAIIPTGGDLSSLLMIYINIAIFAIIFPNEVIMFVVGFLVAIGKLSFLTLPFVIAVNTLVSIIYYTISIQIKQRYLNHSSKLEQAKVFFYRYGKSSILFSRLIPTLRVYISFVAGISHMDRSSFILYTVYGYGILNSIWFFLGYFSSNMFTDIREVNFENFTLYSLTLFGVFSLFYISSRYLTNRVER